ncbi:MAG: DNA topoisomerase I, partial [Muribaculaceae bacterium]|nr:DNA topoisomerase I [Muribaculaceae bacterium]
YEGSDVTVAIGRFGPYVKHEGKFVSIPKGVSPGHITLEEAAELIRDKRAAEANRLVKSFDEEPGMQILNGRYGVYIAYNKNNYKIPKTVADPAALTLDECREIVASQETRPRRAASRSKKK